MDRCRKVSRTELVEHDSIGRRIILKLSMYLNIGGPVEDAIQINKYILEL